MKTQKMTEVEKRMMTEVETQYVYLLQTREFLNSKEPVYKIGRSKQDNYSRFSQYDLGSVLLFQSSCSDNIKLEREIIDLFSKKYEHIKIVGKEWFRGDVDEMRVDFCDIVKNSITTGKLKNNDTISVQDVVVEEGCVEDIVVEERIHQYLLEEGIQDVVEENIPDAVVEENIPDAVVEENIPDAVVEEGVQQYLVEENIPDVVEEIDIIIEDVENDNIVIEDVENNNIVIEDVENDVEEDVENDVENDVEEDVECKSIMIKKKGSKFCCDICNYSTCVKSNMQKHFKSNKHELNENPPIIDPENPPKFHCKVCSKCYKSQSGLWKHSQTCKVVEVELPVVPEIVPLDLHTKIENLERVIGKLTSLVENNLTIASK
jgi:hypothetical protein